MTKEEYEYILEGITQTGCDFADIYYQDGKTKIYSLVDSKIDNIKYSTIKGLGIRTKLEDKIRYIATNDLSKENIDLCIDSLKSNYHSCRVVGKISLNEEKIENIIKPKIGHDEYPVDKKIELLKKIDKIARKESKLINQVIASIIEVDNNFTIANTENKLVNSSYCNTRIIVKVYAEKDGNKEYSFDRIGVAKGYEMLDEIDLEKLIKNLVKETLNKLNAITIKGGEYPVILARGFGAVIFHEACGHGLEATSVAPKTSCFTDLLGNTIASEKVTLIDDGTIPNMWGSVNVDDEGTLPQKNVLIEKGILKSYLVDKKNTKLMNHKLTGSGRRECYIYPPTSRMNNTYLEKGTDKIEDMIKSIDYGIFCHSLGGGLVDTTSGSFNFCVDNATLIEKGKLTKPLRDLCLIGTGSEILKRVEMVSDDLELTDGYCGSESGTVYVNIGQPTIKISKMLVGGKND